MTRIVGHHVPREMALLGLVELTLSFLLIDFALRSGGVEDLLSAASPAWSRNCTGLAAMLALTIAAIGATIGLYRPAVFSDRKRLLSNAIVAGILAFPGALLVSSGFHLRPGVQEVGWFALVLLVWLGSVLAIRILFGLVLQHAGLARRVIIVGQSERAGKIGALLRARRGGLFDPIVVDTPVSTFSAGFSPGAFGAKRIWGVVLLAEQAGVSSVTLASATAIPQDIRVFDECSFLELYLGRIDLSAMTEDWLRDADGFATGSTADALKRGLDVVVSASLLMLMLPLMAITAMLVRRDSPGPALYRQQRAGLHGKPFILLKFRSMRMDAEAGGQPCWAQQRDPRVTRIGNFIRLTRIDELPQLINVLQGHMSMIGPRPERPHFVRELAVAIPFFHERGKVKPGITGWAQVNFPYGASIEDAREKLAYDLYYVKNRNLFLDLFILVATVRVILFRDGAR